LVAVFRVGDRSGFWLERADFDRPLGRPARHLIGDERAQQLAVNVALPWALAVAQRRALSWLTARIAAVYAALPASPLNQVEREMVAQLGGLPGLKLDARRQQGLLHLHHAGCLPRRCEGCPVLGNPAG
jgi:hypothetical protein